MVRGCQKPGKPNILYNYDTGVSYISLDKFFFFFFFFFFFKKMIIISIEKYEI